MRSLWGRSRMLRAPLGLLPGPAIAHNERQRHRLERLGRPPIGRVPHVREVAHPLVRNLWGRSRMLRAPLGLLPGPAIALANMAHGIPRGCQRQAPPVGPTVGSPDQHFVSNATWVLARIGS